jgi:hypothetical protein
VDIADQEGTHVDSDNGLRMSAATIDESEHILRIHVPPDLLRLLILGPFLFVLASVVTLLDPVEVTLACEREVCTLERRWLADVQVDAVEFPRDNLAEARSQAVALHGFLPAPQVVLNIGGEPTVFPGIVDVTTNMTAAARAVNSWVQRPVDRLEVVAGNRVRGVIFAALAWISVAAVLARNAQAWTLVLDRRRARLKLRSPGLISQTYREMPLKDLRDARPRYSTRRWYVELKTFEGSYDAIGSLRTETEAAVAAERIMAFRRTLGEVH